MNARALFVALVLAALAALAYRWRAPHRPGVPHLLQPHAPGASATPRPIGTHPPAVLVVAPERFWNGWVDLDVMRELVKAGFQMDWTEAPGELKWEKLSTYDAAVVYRLPGGEPGKALVALFNRFQEAGGGVLVLNGCEDGEDGLAPLIGGWGAHLTRRQVRESDEAKLAELPGTGGRYQLALTREIAPHPVTVGVRALWLPQGEVARTGASVPLTLTGEWEVLVRAGPTARLAPPGPRPPPPRVKPGEAPPAPPPIPAADQNPPLVAARQRGAGRVVLAGVWPDFTLGQGKQWPSRGAVLTTGAAGVPSDGFVLLKNALAWLCEPAEKSGKLGGARTPPARLVDPDTTPEARAALASPAPPAPPRPSLRGVIGARTAVTGGAGSAADWAKAAAAAKLDYLVITEDFAGLTPDKWRALTQECAKASSPALALIPGWQMASNLGGSVLVWGNNVAWPPADALEGTPPVKLVLRSLDGQGKNVVHPPAQRWLTGLARGDAGAAWWAGSGPWRAAYVRPMGAVVALGEDGGALTDGVDDYREAIARGVPVLPLGVSRVDAPAELAKAKILTVVQARAADRVLAEALHWPQPNEAAHVVATSGPLVARWGALEEARSFAGADGQLAGACRTLDPGVTAAAGLARVTVTDGDRTLRQADASAPLSVCALEQHALVLDAADRAGGRAVTSVYRTDKAGGVELAPGYDRQFDQRVLLAQFALGRPAEVQGGYTSGAVPHTGPPVLNFPDWYPVAITTRGAAVDHPAFARTWLDASDEHAVQVRFHADRIIEESSGVNFAPPSPASVKPTRVATVDLSYVELCRPSAGPAPVGPPGRAKRVGPTAAVLTQRLESGGDQLLHSVRWLIGHTPRESEALTVGTRRAGTAWQTFEVTPGLAYRLLPVASGTWIRLESPALRRQVVLLPKGPPLTLQVEPQDHGVEVRFVSSFAGRAWPHGEPLSLRLLSWTDPTDGSSGVDDANALVSDLDPVAGLAVAEGKLVDDRGEVTVAAAQGRARLAVGPLPHARDATVPVTVYGLTRAWSAWSVTRAMNDDGVAPVVSPVSVDSSGAGTLAAHPGPKAALSLSVGHPVLASDPRVRVSVLPCGVDPQSRWVVEVENPTDAAIEVTLEPGLPLPGLTLGNTTLTLAPGQARRIVP